MIKYLWHAILDVLDNENAAPARIRAVLGFLASAATVVIASASASDGTVNFEMLRLWGWKGWLMRMGLAAIAGAAMLLRAGEKNRTPEEIRAALDSLPWDGKDRRGARGPTP